jgi:hypothetical protein
LELLEMSGSKGLSTSDTRIEALNLQSSAYGVAVQLLYGTNRIAGNMVWYGGFKATAVKTSQGGKGGSAKSTSTNYTYSASVIMGLCEGQITGITRAWKGKQLFSGGVTGGQLITVSESYTPPAGGGTFTCAHSAAFSASIDVAYTLGGTNNTKFFAEGTDYQRVGGVYTFSPTSPANSINLTITYQYQASGTAQTALQLMGLSLKTGALAQSTWAFLNTFTPTNPPGATGSQAIGYSGLAYVYAQDYSLGTSAQVDNHTFEVQGPMAFSISTSIPDANPALATWDAIINGRYGAGFPTTQLGDPTAWATYCLAAGLLLSPTLETQMQANEFAALMAKVTNTAPVWDGKKLSMIPYGDTTITGNGVTFTPNVTPIYDLTDDDYIGGGVDPIKVKRSRQSDAYNQAQVEFVNRSNLYNIEIATAQDSANIDAFGLRAAQVLPVHHCCDAAIARNIAQLLLQRTLFVRNTYRFTLSWTKVLLSPMDLVTLTDSGLMLNKKLVRIVSVDESASGDLDFVAEECNIGVAHAALYPNASGGGFQHDYNAAPGSASAPVIFEAPPSLTVTGLEVYSGAGANWGGCNVWTSLDGTNYKQVGTVYGPARSGTLSTVAGSTVGVQGMTGPLSSGSAADSAAFSTLCYIGGANPEYMAFTSAALTGAGAYTLSGLTRGGFGTSSAVHAVNDPFVRVDSTIVKSGALDLGMIGSTLHVKLTSFNVYGGGEESLATVTDYVYPITGAIVKLPPIPPTAFTAVSEQFGIRLTCTRSVDPDVIGYEYRVGASWATGTVITSTGGTSYLWQAQAIGSFTFWVAAIDVFGNYSAAVSVSANVLGGSISGYTQTFSGTDLILAWTAVAGAFATQTTEVRYGATFATATVVGQFASAYRETVYWGGSRVYWLVPIDVRGNYGTPVQTTVSITAPGAISGQRVDVVDNNALVYWSAPSTGTLPVDHYEVRKGSTWAGGVVIGSNGNSTFTGVFEQVAGVFTYWIAAWDTAGNIGTPASVVATILQPPDYVLRTNFNSALGGTLSNMYIEQGNLIGPVNTATTFGAHFTGNSWTSPQDQITAGYAVYVEPSVSSGTYTEVFDYGTVLQATNVTITPNATLVAGTETLTCQIYTSLDNITFTAVAAGFSALCANFRYIKFVLTITGTPGANLVSISQINVKLSIKQRMDSGLGTSVAGGVTVNFGYPFIEADYPMVQAGGVDTFGKPYTVAVIYTGPPNPTSFGVRIFNSAGTDVSGVPFSWTARGY